MSTFGGSGSSLSGGGAGFGGGGAGKAAGLGEVDSSGTESDFFRENCDFVAEDFSAVRDGTRRPRGRFSESKMAIFLYIGISEYPKMNV
jgi:hypothetical protein